MPGVSAMRRIEYNGDYVMTVNPSPVLTHRLSEKWHPVDFTLARLLKRPFTQIWIHGNHDQATDEVYPDEYIVGSCFRKSFHVLLNENTIAVVIRSLRRSIVDSEEEVSHIGVAHIQTGAKIFSEFLQRFSDNTGPFQVFICGGKGVDPKIMKSICANLIGLKQRAEIMDDLSNFIPSGHTCTIQTDKSGNPIIMGLDKIESESI